MFFKIPRLGVSDLKGGRDARAGGRIDARSALRGGERVGRGGRSEKPHAEKKPGRAKKQKAQYAEIKKQK